MCVCPITGSRAPVCATCSVWASQAWSRVTRARTRHCGTCLLRSCLTKFARPSETVDPECAVCCCRLKRCTPVPGVFILTSPCVCSATVCGVSSVHVSTVACRSTTRVDAVSEPCGRIQRRPALVWCRMHVRRDVMCVTHPFGTAARPPCHVLTYVAFAGCHAQGPRRACTAMCSRVARCEYRQCCTGVSRSPTAAARSPTAAVPSFLVCVPRLADR